MRWSILKVNFEGQTENIIENIDLDMINIIENICTEKEYKYKCIYGNNILFDPEYELCSEQIKDLEMELSNKIKKELDEYLKKCISLQRNSVKIPLFLLDIFGSESRIEERFDAVGYRYKVEEDAVIIDLSSQDALCKNNITSDLEKLIYDDIAPTLEDNFCPVSIKEIKTSEILSNFVMKNDGNEIIDILYKSEHLQILYENQSEQDLIEKIDYKRISDNYLIHNVRKPNIIISELSSNGIGLFIVGYLKVDDQIYVTIKAFNFSILKILFDYFKKETNIINVKESLEWKELNYRVVEKGYRESKRHIIENELAKRFLEMSKKDYFKEEFKFILLKLLNKGYLSSEEFSKEEFIKGGKKKTIADQNQISKFLIEYLLLEESSFKKEFGSCLFSVSSGKIFGNAREKSDTEKFYCIDCKRVYAPSKNLLYFIRAYWHQQYVGDVLYEIQKIWDEERNILQIKNIERDLKFDFLNEKPKKPTKDIDLLIRVIHKQTREEFIIAIEAKRNSGDYSKELKQIPQKIDLLYANIFSAFIFISYFDTMSSEQKSKIEDLNEQKLIWNQTGLKDANINQIIKSFYLIQRFSFNELVDDVKQVITKICDR